MRFNGVPSGRVAGLHLVATSPIKTYDAGLLQSLSLGSDEASFCSNVAGLNRSGTVIVCRYGPAGDYMGRAPYEETSGACLDLDNDDVLQSDDADDTDRSVQ